MKRTLKKIVATALAGVLTISGSAFAFAGTQSAKIDYTKKLLTFNTGGDQVQFYFAPPVKSATAKKVWTPVATGAAIDISGFIGKTGDPNKEVFWNTSNGDTGAKTVALKSLSDAALASWELDYLTSKMTFKGFTGVANSDNNKVTVKGGLNVATLVSGQSFDLTGISKYSIQLEPIANSSFGSAAKPLTFAGAGPAPSVTYEPVMNAIKGIADTGMEYRYVASGPSLALTGKSPRYPSFVTVTAGGLTAGKLLLLGKPGLNLTSTGSIVTIDVRKSGSKADLKPPSKIKTIVVNKALALPADIIVTTGSLKLADEILKQGGAGKFTTTGWEMAAQTAKVVASAKKIIDPTAYTAIPATMINADGTLNVSSKILKNEDVPTGTTSSSLYLRVKLTTGALGNSKTNIASAPIIVRLPVRAPAISATTAVFVADNYGVKVTSGGSLSPDTVQYSYVTNKTNTVGTPWATARTTTKQGLVLDGTASFTIPFTTTTPAGMRLRVKADTKKMATSASLTFFVARPVLPATAAPSVSISTPDLTQNVLVSGFTRGVAYEITIGAKATTMTDTTVGKITTTAALTTMEFKGDTVKNNNYINIRVAATRTTAASPIKNLQIKTADIGVAAATLQDVDVSGTSKQALTVKKMDVTITLDSLKTSISDKADVSTWFTGLPSGVTTQALAANAGDKKVSINFGGTPMVAASAPIVLTIPADKLNSGVAIKSTANASAKFTIK